MGKREPQKRRKTPKGPRRQNLTQVAFLMKELHKGALLEKREPQKRRKAPKGPRRQNPTKVAFLIKELHKREGPKTYASVLLGPKHATQA